MRYVVAILVVLWSGVAWGERLQRLDFEIAAPDGPEHAWMFLYPDRLDLISPQILGRFHTERGRTFGGSSTLTQSIDTCSRTTDATFAAVHYCNLDYRNLSFPWVAVSEATPRLIAATYSVATAFRPQPDSDIYYVYQDGLATTLPMTYIGMATFDVIGDITQDGSVDASDAAQLFSDWGNPDQYTANSTVVDAASAGVLFANWTGDVSAVPEPSFPLAALLLAIRYRQR